jgi:PIN domain nuclease of toxin-antitoxin system
MLILDAGAFIASERGNEDVAALVKRELEHGRVPLTNGGVVAQVWRGGNGKQVRIARLLANVNVVPVDNDLGRRAGRLLARTGSTDAIDASVVCLAQDGDDVLTSDPADLQALAHAAAVHVDLISI